VSIGIRGSMPIMFGGSLAPLCQDGMPIHASLGANLGVVLHRENGTILGEIQALDLVLD
jgi:hypothetical protein